MNLDEKMISRVLWGTFIVLVILAASMFIC